MMSHAHAQLFVWPRRSMMREDHVQQIRHGLTPRTDSSVVQYGTGALRYENVRRLAEDRCKGRDMTDRWASRVHTDLKSRVDLAAIVQEDEVGEPVKLNAVERFPSGGLESKTDARQHGQRAKNASHSA